MLEKLIEDNIIYGEEGEEFAKQQKKTFNCKITEIQRFDFVHALSQEYHSFYTTAHFWSVMQGHK